MSEKTSGDPFLRIIAIFKLIKATLFIGAGIFLLQDMHKDVQKQVEFLMGNLHIDTENHLAKWCLDKAGELTRTKIAGFSAVCFFYGTLFSIEGTGLYLRKRWAEWMVVILTGSLLPYEAYLIWTKVSALKLALIACNLIILFYLITVIRRKKAK